MICCLLVALKVFYPLRVFPTAAYFMSQNFEHLTFKHLNFADQIQLKMFSVSPCSQPIFQSKIKLNIG